MNENQKILVNLLNVSIGLSKDLNINKSIINWNYIYKEARINQVHTLMYPLMKTIYTKFCCNSEIIDMWKRETLLCSIYQTQHVNQIKNVLDKFNTFGINVVILKGLVLRELYPYPNLRTMSDADILIHKEDIKKSKKILLDLGYYESESNSKHIIFYHKSHMNIELHWALINDSYSKNAAYFESTAWDNVVNVNLLDLKVSSLSPEYQLLFLCLHLLDHTLYTGFGLRQLCDIVLLIKSTDKIFDWNKFFNIVTKCKLRKFVIIIFSVCANLFNISIPNIDISQDIELKKIIEVFTDIIVCGGVYGRRKTSDSYSYLLLNYINSKKQNSLKYKILGYIYLLFPSPRSLDNRFYYAKNHTILLPIAWIHRIVCKLQSKNYSVHANTSFISNMAMERIEKKDFIKWLEI